MLFGLVFGFLALAHAANSSFSHRSCSLSGWQCLWFVVLGKVYWFQRALHRRQHFFGLLCRQHALSRA